MGFIDDHAVAVLLTEFIIGHVAVTFFLLLVVMMV